MKVAAGIQEDTLKHPLTTRIVYGSKSKRETIQFEWNGLAVVKPFQPRIYYAPDIHAILFTEAFNSCDSRLFSSKILYHQGKHLDSLSRD